MALPWILVEVWNGRPEAPESEPVLFEIENECQLSAKVSCQGPLSRYVGDDTH